MALAALHGAAHTEIEKERRYTMHMTIATKEETAEVDRDELADGLETLANNIRSLVRWPKNGILAVEIESLILVGKLDKLIPLKHERTLLHSSAPSGSTPDP